MVDHGIPWSSDHHFHLGFSVTFLVLNDVNLRESNVIKPLHKESVLIRS